MELLECLCMSECVCSVNIVIVLLLRRIYLFFSTFFSSLYFFFICTYTVWYNTLTCMCAVALCSIPTARVVHVEFFCEVSFVFYLRQWDVCWLTTSSWSGDLAFLFCLANSFSVIILFSLSQCPWLYIALLFQVQVNHDN